MDTQTLTPDQEQELLNSIAAKYNIKRVIMLKVPLDGSYEKFTYGFIRYPTRVDVSIAMTMQNTDPLRGKEIVLRNSWLEGDTQLLDDDELFYRACTALDEVLSIRQALVKKNWANGL